MQSSLIVGSFSQAAPTYDAHADVQKLVAVRLVDHFFQQSAPPPLNGEILEIGCGAGALTRQLLLRFPLWKITATDASRKMLEECFRHVGLRCDGRLAFEVLNANSLNVSSSFDLVASSFVIQWLADPVNALRRQLSIVKKGGRVLFAVPSNNCFPEWQEICKRGSLPFTRNTLPSIGEFRAAFPSGQFRQIELTKAYDSPLHFFRTLKRSGADQRLKPNSHKSSLNKLIKLWTCAAGENKTQVTWTVILGVIGRD